MKSESMRDRFVSVVTELLDTEPRVAIVLADITVDRFRASGACECHPLRVINVGIREQLMLNVAAGMALGGMRAIAHSFAPFLIERAFEQVKLAFSHQGIGGILVSCGASYDVAAYGRTHEAPEDVALMGDAAWVAHPCAGARRRGGDVPSRRGQDRRRGVYPAVRTQERGRGAERWQAGGAATRVARRADGDRCRAHAGPGDGGDGGA